MIIIGETGCGGRWEFSVLSSWSLCKSVTILKGKKFILKAKCIKGIVVFLKCFYIPRDIS